ncbi:MAG: energy-coupling factor ABC transporter permease [Sulfurisoma sp.]|nr:energy-coupling factor ABC transporter permease [Sulfurisoma sp.]
MHIPDGFLSGGVLGATALGGLAVFSVSSARLKNSPPERIPLLGAAAAWVFAVQLLAFPAPGGASVHLNGVLLCAALLGPWSAALVSFSALLLSALMFQHGGLFSLGANFINIGVIQAFLGFALWRLRPAASSALVIGPLLGFLSGLACAVELYLSGRLASGAGFLLLAGAQAAAGLAEGAVTASLLGALSRLKPGLLRLERV